MPTVLLAFGFRVGFYSSDGNEPVHVHVVKGRERAKFWIHRNGTVTVESVTKGFRESDLSKAERLVLDNIDLIQEKWHDHFGA